MSASQDGHGGLLALGVRRPIGVGMVVAAAVVFGVVALGKLHQDLLPPIQYPSLTVRTAYPGAAPEDVEERVTDRLEDVLSTVGGLVALRSSSRAEVSEIVMQFQWGEDLPLLVQDVRERMDRVFLPPGVDDPLILRYDPNLDPVMRIAVSGGDDLVRLRDLAESEIERGLEGLPGVAAVRVQAGMEDEVEVLFDPQRLAQLDLTPEVVLQRLREENLNVPGGTVEEGAFEYVVRTLNEFRTLDEIRELPLQTRGERVLHLRDVAEVRRFHKERDRILRVGGAEAVEVAIYREAGANLVAVADAVRARLWGARRGAEAAEATAASNDGGRRRGPKPIVERLPDDVRVTLLSDQSDFVRGAIADVRQAAVLGGAFAVAVCYFFLRRWGSTLVIGLAVPVSIVATFGAMLLAGVSLNIMSLGGLALGVGMLVDNAIVVLESITRRRELGDPPLTAAINGVREVGGAVTASTLTTVAVFAPIVFVEGIAGQTFGDQALTVVASLSISLAVALFFVPGLAARLGGDAPPPRRLAAGLLPHLRAPRRLFAGGHVLGGRTVWVLAVASGAVGAWLLLAYLPGAERAARAAAAAVAEPPTTPDEVELADDVLMRLALLRLAGLALVVFPVMTFGQPVFLALGRLLSDLVGLVAVAATALFAGLLGLLWLVLWPATRLFQATVAALTDHLYPRLLRGALRIAPLVLFAGVLAGAWAWRAGGDLGSELLPEVLQGEFRAELRFPPGTPLAVTDRWAGALERRIRELPFVEATAVSAGTDRETVSNRESGPHVAEILVRVAPDAAERRTVELQVEREVRAILESAPELARYEIRRPTLMSIEAPLEIELLGEDLAVLAEAAVPVEEALRRVPGLTDLRSSLRRGNPEVRITLDREQLARHGLVAQEVANRLRLAVEGEAATTFPGQDERIDVRVRADLSRLQRVAQLRDLPVNPGADRPLPLGAVADFTVQDGPSDIRHVDSRRAVVFSASPAGFDLGATTRAVEEALAEVPLPPGVEVRLAGQSREMQGSLRSLAMALALAVFLVYAVMAAQFESLLQPFLILFAVPLAGVGAIAVLLATGTPLSVIALLGAVILAGIVVNNAIVLVDRINQNRRRGLAVPEAIVEAGTARLRPILMTTVTTVLGMLPLTGWLPFLGGTDGIELRAPMAMVVIAGLLSSTLLTLVVVPCGYLLLARRLGGGGRSEAAAAAESVPPSS